MTVEGDVAREIYQLKAFKSILGPLADAASGADESVKGLPSPPYAGKLADTRRRTMIMRA